MTPPREVAVIGLGLIGGSLAHDLARGGVRVSAYDCDESRLHAAMRAGVVHVALDATLGGVADADVVVLAVPVDAAPALLGQVAPLLGAGSAVTDTGSTKRAIGDAALALGIGERFVGSHPLAGDHRSGFDAARAGLFEDAPVYLCPTARTDADTLARVRAMWELAGARPEEMDPATHDTQLAWTSHLPQLVSSAVAIALGNRGLLPAMLGRGGRDVTRLAASHPALWASVAMDNADELREALAAAEGELAAFRAVLARGDATAVRDRLDRARQWSAAT